MASKPRRADEPVWVGVERGDSPGRGGSLLEPGGMRPQSAGRLKARY